MRHYVGTQDAPFALIADPFADLYTLYGVESSEAKLKRTMAMSTTQQRIAEAAAAGFRPTEEAGSNFLRMPADFFIGADGGAGPEGTVCRLCMGSPAVRTDR